MKEFHLCLPVNQKKFIKKVNVCKAQHRQLKADGLCMYVKVYIADLRKVCFQVLQRTELVWAG